MLYHDQFPEGVVRSLRTPVCAVAVAEAEAAEAG